MASKAFFDMIKHRRSLYQLQKSSPISNTQIKDIITQTVLHVPSPFNLQSTRVILLLGEEHDRLWEITKESFKQILSAERFPATEKKLDGFKAGYGTVGCPFPPDPEFTYYKAFTYATQLMTRYCFLMPSLLFRPCKLNFQRMQTASPHGRLNLVSLPPPYLRT